MLKGTDRRFTTVGKSGFITSASVNNRQAAPVSRNFVTSALADAGGGGGGYSAGYNSTGKSAFIKLLDGFVPPDTKMRNMLFKDIYDHDPVAGAAVDIYATMPFSDFYLTGLKDRSILDTFHKSIERMRIKVILPAISRDYLVYGRFVGSTVFDANENIFSDIMPQDSNSLEITSVPFAGMDPLIDLTVPPNLKKFMENTTDPRVQNILKSIPQHIRENYQKGKIPLEPANTLFIPRRTGVGDSIGTSYYERILPVHIMEKAMIRGSIDQVQRRQRSIFHITVTGDGDDYVPTIANLESIRDLFVAADQDPTGAIIVTHSGVQPNEVRDASSFFRADELFEYFNSTKYKALGVSEAMITGEANFNSMDATLSLFIENIREYRTMITRELFYEKIFPAIAYANGYTKERYTVTGTSEQIGHNSRYMHGDDDYLYAVCSDERHGFNFRDQMIDTSTLAMPIVSWQKHLRPEGDEAFLNLLSAAEQHGVPIPLVMFASASGLDLNAILNSLDQEKAIRKRVQKYSDAIAEFANPNDQNQMQASFLKAASSGSKLKPKNLLTRDYPDWLLPHNKDKMGRFKVTSAKTVKHEYGKQLKMLQEVMAKRNEESRAKARAQRKPR